ncbi:N-acetylglucosaminyl-phosphatidylinositol de-N-acetylase-like [Ciona intestinalis]
MVGLILCSVILLSCVLFTQKYLRRQSQLPFFGLSASDNALLVISHPDDECIFFAPTILALLDKKVTVHIVCLSSGNYYGQGEKRILELYSSCLKLGLQHSNIHCLTKFHDGPNVLWNPEEISEVLLEYLSKSKSKVLLTFDESGISGHPNHIAVNSAVKFMIKHRLTASFKPFVLETVPIVRKYLQILDIIPTIIFLNQSQVVVLSSCAEYFKAISAMQCHRTQLVWFRWLIVAFSRNMLINTWSTVELNEK